MPIGAAIGVGVVGAGASVYGASKAAKAQKSAANTAAETELQTAQMNNAFAQQMYDQNAARLDPYSQMGTAAGSDIMELLLGKPSGGGTWAKPATPAPVTGSTGTPVPTSGYAGPALGAIGSQSQMDAYLGYYGAHPELDPGFTSIAQFHGDPYKDEAAAGSVLAAHQAYVASHPATPVPTATPAAPVANNALATAAPAAAGGFVPLADRGDRPDLTDYAGDLAGRRSALDAWRNTNVNAPGGAPAAGGTPATGTPAAGGNTASDAWDKFRNSTNYQFRLDQGLEGVNTKYAAMGAIESGAAMKAVNDYAQNFASNELSQYMDQLYRQEALGASAASSLAGVGTAMVGQVSANNSAAGSAAANAALVRGQASANQWGTIGNAVGTAAGAIGGAMGSSYGGGGGYDYAALGNSGIYGNALNF